MDGGSSSVVELGRFLTGFLVVMGVGMQYAFPFCLVEDRLRVVIKLTCGGFSAACRPGALRYDPDRGDGDEYCWWIADLWNDYLL